MMMMILVDMGSWRWIDRRRTDESKKENNFNSILTASP